MSIEHDLVRAVDSTVNGFFVDFRRHENKTVTAVITWRIGIGGRSFEVVIADGKEVQEGSFVRALKEIGSSGRTPP